MKLFNKKKIKDERLLTIQNKIYKEIYFLIMAICFISIALKFYLYDIKAQFAIVEFIIILFSSIYYLIRSICLGIYSDEIEIHDRTSKIPMTIKNVLIGLGAGFIIALLFGIRNSILYGNDSNRLWYFILVFTGSFAIYCPISLSILTLVNYFGKKTSIRINKINEESDEDLGE